MVIGDFNAKSSKWNCQDQSAFKGNVIDSITSQFGIYQVIKEPTHMLLLRVLTSFLRHYLTQ